MPLLMNMTQIMTNPILMIMTIRGMTITSIKDMNIIRAMVMAMIMIIPIAAAIHAC